MPADTAEQLWFEGLVHLEPFEALDGRALVERHLARRRRRTRAGIVGGVAAACALSLGVAAATNTGHDDSINADVGDADREVSPTTVVNTATTIASKSAQPAVPAGGGAPRERDPKTVATTIPDAVQAPAAPDPATGMPVAPPTNGPGTSPVEPVEPAPDGTPLVRIAFGSDGVPRASQNAILLGTFDVLLEGATGEATWLSRSGSNTPHAPGERVRLTHGVGLATFTVARDDERWSVPVLVQAPALPAPLESPGTITMELASDTLAFPLRTVGVGAPWVEGFGGPNKERWISLASSTPVFRLANPDRRQIDIAIVELPEAARTTHDDSIVFKPHLGPTDSRRYTLTVRVDGGPQQRLVLWMT
jgi:hypothetical protein